MNITVAFEIIGKVVAVAGFVSDTVKEQKQQAQLEEMRRGIAALAEGQRRIETSLTQLFNELKWSTLVLEATASVQRIENRSRLLASFKKGDDLSGWVNAVLDVNQGEAFDLSTLHDIIVGNNFLTDGTSLIDAFGTRLKERVLLVEEYQKALFYLQAGGYANLMNVYSLKNQQDRVAETKALMEARFTEQTNKLVPWNAPKSDRNWVAVADIPVGKVLVSGTGPGGRTRYLFDTTTLALLSLAGIDPNKLGNKQGFGYAVNYQGKVIATVNEDISGVTPHARYDGKLYTVEWGKINDSGFKVYY
jgi:hypothetical protein